MSIRFRPLTPDEQAAVQRLDHSRTVPARVVERAQNVSFNLTLARTGLLAVSLTMVGVGLVRPTVAAPVSTQPLTKPAEQARNPREPSAAQAREIIARRLNDAVPIGSSRSRVEQWLRTQRMEIQWVTGPTLRRSDYASLLSEHGHTASNLSGVIVSFRREKLRAETFVAPLFFFFDTEENLVASSVEDATNIAMRRVPGKPTRTQMLRLVRQALPLGTSRKTVEKWLDERRILHSYLDARTHNLSDSSAVRDSGLRSSRLGGIIQGNIRGISTGGWWRSDLQLVFFFNKRSRLVATSVTEIGIGP
jgi:hypothetical protein